MVWWVMVGRHFPSVWTLALSMECTSSQTLHLLGERKPWLRSSSGTRQQVQTSPNSCTWTVHAAMGSLDANTSSSLVGTRTALIQAVPLQVRGQLRLPVTSMTGIRLTLPARPTHCKIERYLQLLIIINFLMIMTPWMIRLPLLHTFDPDPTPVQIVP